MFLAEHADAAVYSGLLVSCKAGRAWVLRTARAARLTLDCTRRQPDLRGVRPALCARGGKATTLVVKCDEAERTTQASSCEADAEHASQGQRVKFCLADLPEQLAGCGSGITELHLGTAHLQATLLPIGLASFLHSAAPHMPNLATLHLDTFPTQLPPPSLFTAITRLVLRSKSADWPATAGYSSVAAYMPQLSHIQLQQHYGWHYAWPLLFTPAMPAQHLTSLHTNCTLTAQLLGLLLEHAPQLQGLGASRVDWDVTRPEPIYRERQWGVRSLSLQHAHLGTLAALPQCSGPQLTVTCDSATILVSGPEVR